MIEADAAVLDRPRDGRSRAVVEVRKTGHVILASLECGHQVRRQMRCLATRMICRRCR